METEKTAKRTYKDSVFRSIFVDRNRLSHLYEALTGEKVDARQITVNTLKSVFFNAIHNDISFQVGGRLIVLVEHQSTWNPNMPLRMLWYADELYRENLDRRLPYKRELVKIPTPEFYMFYNGTEEMEQKKILRLSDAFLVDRKTLELEVTCWNINYSENNELLQRCSDLRAYSIFVHQVRKGVKEGLSRERAIRQAIRYCIDGNHLQEYFKAHEWEVLDMVSYEWDENLAREVAMEEGEARGIAKGRREGAEQGRADGIQEAKSDFAVSLLKDHTPLAKIVQWTKLPEETVRRLARENGITV